VFELRLGNAAIREQNLTQTRASRRLGHWGIERLRHASGIIATADPAPGSLGQSRARRLTGLATYSSSKAIRDLGLCKQKAHLRPSRLEEAVRAVDDVIEMAAASESDQANARRRPRHRNLAATGLVT
jgi:hypothetical protein